jgi:hypothetical protein
MHEIPERDWRVFRELREVALERMCERVLKEVREEAEREGKSWHERYLAVNGLIHDRRKEIARGFDGARRSVAWEQLAII